VPAAERLQLRLLVGAEHVLVRAQTPSLEAALVEIEHPARLPGEVRVADEDPGALLPRLQGVVVQPAPAEASLRPRSTTSGAAQYARNG
jgi:hypothetical protein